MAVKSSYEFFGYAVILRFFEIVAHFAFVCFPDALFFDMVVLYFIEYLVKQAFYMFLSQLLFAVEIFGVSSNFGVISVYLWLSFFDDFVSDGVAQWILHVSELRFVQISISE